MFTHPKLMEAIATGNFRGSEIATLLVESKADFILGK
jgi:hypothetical protein